jgi:uncharacterized protein (TIGR02246 family)
MTMKAIRTTLCLAILAATLAPAFAQANPADSKQAILTVLNKSADDWNHGDLDAFATSYKNSPDILFIGTTIQHGYAQMLAHYKAAYSSREKMGTLTFTQLEVQPLDDHFATVTGQFHLDRTAAGGGNADGHFLLVAELTPDGWKIIRDDTTVLPPPAKR